MLAKSRVFMATFVAGLTLLATVTAQVVFAADDLSVPPASGAGPIFAPVVSAQQADGQTLSARINKVMSGGNVSSRASVVIVDATSGKTLLDRHGSTALIPASTLKLVTAAAAISTLGANATFHTDVVRASSVLTLVGGGDPTLTTRTPTHWRGKPAGVQRPASLEELAQRTAKQLGSHAGTFTLKVDATYFAGSTQAQSWPSSFVRNGYVAPVTGLMVDFGVDAEGHALNNPATVAGKFFTAALNRRGIHATFAGQSKAAQAASEVASVNSATLTDIVERMLTTSNNTMGEYLAHHVGRTAGDSTFEGSAKAVEKAVSQLGIVTDGMSLHDGSGLSSDDRVTARTLVSLLGAAQTSHTELWPILSGLPIAGVSGTLAARFSHSAAGRGYVRAKTGTLSGVVALAGTTVDQSGDLLTFAIMANDVPQNYQAETTLDSALKELSRCGCQ